MERVLDAAAGLVGSRMVTIGGQSFRADCSGFVSAAYHVIGLDLIDPSVPGGSGTELIYRSLKARGRVRSGPSLAPGDLLFFHNTWDRNGNRLRDDRFTHVGLVQRIESDGRAVFLHFASGGVTEGVINLRHPDAARDPESGARWNSQLRRGPGRTLAGQLFFKSARPL